ncbi:MAG: hypothetical protein WBW33_01580 [Bryobacteraceae bacterium]
MGKLVVVQGDAVQGTDTHTVSGNATNPAPPPPTVPYAGSGSYSYKGAITQALSTFVTIGGVSVALKTSQSSLNPGELTSGGHAPLAGSNFLPPAPVPIAASLSFLPPVQGVGVPNAASGSALLTVGGVKVLLDGDKIDTCDGTGSANSTVTASGQSFVSCSG